MEQQAQSRQDHLVPDPYLPTVQSQVPQPDRAVPESAFRHIGTSYRRIYYRQVTSHPAQPDVRRHLSVPSQGRQRNSTGQATHHHLWQRTDQDGIPQGPPVHRGEIHRGMLRPRRDSSSARETREMQRSQTRLTTPYATVDGVTTSRDNASGGVPPEEGIASEEAATLLSRDRSETYSLLEDPEALPIQPILYSQGNHGSP